MSGFDISGRVPDTGLAENYAAAYGGELQPGSSPALLLVDLVEAYLDPDSPLYAGPVAAEARDVAASLVEVARTNDVPVVWTTVSYEEGGANGGLFYVKVPSLELFVGDGPMGRFPDTVSPREGEVVVAKQYPSAFFGTGLETTLHEMGIDTLVIGGYSTSGCVRASTLDALCHGFVPIVCRDACADRHPDPHEANLFDLQAKYAEVVDHAAAREILTS